MKETNLNSSMGLMAKLFIVTLLLQGCNQKQERPPNFVFFLVDDLGWSDVGCYGSDYYKTPNIDKLAEEGMLFTNAYSGSTVCSPSRASLLTGKYAGRLRITHAIPILGYKRIEEGRGTPLKDADYVMNLPLEEITIAEALKTAGYATASFGKWHVSNEPEYYPEHQGFDINMGGSNRGHTANYFYPYDGRWRMAPGSPWIEWNTLPDGKPGEYLTERLTVEAIKFIENNKHNPFFLYFPHYAVHTPIQVKDEMLKKWEGKAVDSVKGHTHAGYAAMVESVDQSMGALMKKLDELDLTENTIVIFLSDNGGHGRFTSNYPLRGNKGNFYEGGIRVPLVIKWPGVTKPATKSDVPVISNDFYPTMLEMAGLPLMPEQHLDGLSLAPILKQDGGLDREALYWHFPNYIGTGHPDPSGPLGVIRYRDWKLIESFEDGSLELYDLKNDMREEKNLAESNPEMAKRLQKMMADWRISVDAQMPEVNPDYIPKSETTTGK
jgi:arylsulfatase A